MNLSTKVHTGSEHSVEGDGSEPTQYYPAELHVVHAEETMESFAVFGMFIDTNPEDEDQQHETFEYYLQGWEATCKLAFIAICFGKHCGLNHPIWPIWL